MRFQREITTGTRRPLVFYINLDTQLDRRAGSSTLDTRLAASEYPRFETAWAPGAPHLDIATLLREVERLTGSRRERNRQSRQSARGMQRFEVEGAERQAIDISFALSARAARGAATSTASKLRKNLDPSLKVPSDDGRSSLVDAMSAAQRPFLPTMRRPGSSDFSKLGWTSCLDFLGAFPPPKRA